MHTFTERLFALNNEFCRKAFIGMRHLVNSWRKKSLLSDPVSTTTRDIAINRLEAILGSSEDQLEDADIESDCDSSVASHPGFPCNGDTVHNLSSQR